MKQITRRLITMAVGMWMLASVGLAQTPTRLQVLCTGDQARAEAAAAALAKAGYGPAQLQNSPQGIKVLTRAFDSYAEANFAKPALRQLGFEGAFAVSEPQPKSAGASVKNLEGRAFAFAAAGAKRPPAPPAPPAPATSPAVPGNAEALRALDDATAPETELLHKAARAFTAKEDSPKALAAADAFLRRFPQSDKAPAVKMMRAHWLLKSDDAAGARAQFEAVAAAHGDRPEGGEAHLRCAYLMVREKAPDAEVLRRFHRVASAQVAASPEVRLEAMLRCAALYHRGRDLDTAEAAYAVIEQTAAEADTKAFARMQRAGLLLEKAHNGKATYGDARAACDDVVSRFPEADRSTRATAALMAIETLAYERRYADVLTRANAFLAQFDDTEEAPLVYYWTGKAYLETGEAELALKVLDALIAADFPTAKRFQYVDVVGAARRLAARAHESLGRPDKAYALLQGQ